MRAAILTHLDPGNLVWLLGQRLLEGAGTFGCGRGRLFLRFLGFARDRSGRVTLHFNLNYDGSITEVTQLDNTVGPLYGYLCQQALTAPAPYAKWPEEMRRLIGGNVREMTFTFFYY